jgi:hypothetical protein
MDEGEFLRLVGNLLKGNFDFLGIRNSLLLIGRPPLYLWVLAGITKLFGYDILVLRYFSVICGISSIIVIFIFVRQSIGRVAAFYAAFFLALLPEYVLYNRIGFSYNWSSLWMILFVFFLWKYLSYTNVKWLIFSSIAAGIVLASDFFGIIFIIILFLVIVFYEPRRFWILLLVPVPWVISMVPIYLASPIDTWHDLVYNFKLGSGSGENPFFMVTKMVAKYSETFRRQPFIILGIIGLFMLDDKKLRTLLVLLIALLFVILLPSRVLLGHYLLPVWPIISIGLARFLEKSIPYVYNISKTTFQELTRKYKGAFIKKLSAITLSVLPMLIIFLLFFLPVSWLIILDSSSFIIRGGNYLQAMIENPWKEGFLSAEDSEAVVKKISGNLTSNDFVIAPGVISWMLNNNAADPRTVVVYDYGGSSLGIDGFNHNRFVVNSSLQTAKYAVVDEAWREWLTDMAPEIKIMLNEVEKWPIVFERDSLQVFCNPTYCK